jgi:hypothetical protein
VRAGVWPQVSPTPAPPSLPEPAGLPRTVHREDGRSPYYYRDRIRTPRQSPRVGFRLGFGAAGRLAGPLPIRAGFALDALAVGRIPMSRGKVAFGLFPEFGYSLLVGAHKTRGNFFTGGVGLGVIVGPFAAAVIPRAVLGNLMRERAVGVRTGLLVEGSKDGGFSLEVSHEALWVPKGVIHELRVLLSLTVLIEGRNR